MCKDIPKELIVKYWGKIFTLETPFYYNINWSLMKLDNKIIILLFRCFILVLKNALLILKKKMIKYYIEEQILIMKKLKNFGII